MKRPAYARLHEAAQTLKRMIREAEIALGGIRWKPEYETNERTFCTEILAPLLRRMGFLSVRYLQGAREYGKDFTFSELTPLGISDTTGCKQRPVMSGERSTHPWMSLSARRQMPSQCRTTNSGQAILAIFRASWWPSVAASQPMRGKKSCTNCRRGLLAQCSSSIVSQFSNSSTGTGELPNLTLVAPREARNLGIGCKSHDIGCCYPAGTSESPFPPDQSLASRSGANSTCTPINYVRLLLRYRL